MHNVYKKLAGKLDQISNGFEATESGVELKLLQKIFSLKDAAIALQLYPIPETVEVIAKRIGKSISETQNILSRMFNKGQIGSIKDSGKQVYMLYPWYL